MKHRAKAISIFAILLSVLLMSGIKVYADDGCSDGEHFFHTEIVDATETEPGSITYVCEKCGYSYREEIAPYGHNFSVELIEADCVSPGRKKVGCEPLRDLTGTFGQEEDF